MHKMTFVLLSFILLISLGLYSFLYWFNHPTSHRDKSIQYYVTEGSSFSRVARDLGKQDIVGWPSLFIFYGRLTASTNHIKVGTYSFEPSDSPKVILNKLVHGDTIVIKVTIPEGLNIYQYAQKLSEYFPHVKEDDWLHFMESQELINSLGLNEKMESTEGFLYPETYFFDPHSKPSFILKAAIAEFKKNVPPALLQKAKEMGLSPLQFVTFASIVEKETAIPSEREKIAGVYWNRLRLHMKLQADPAVAYGVWSHRHKSLTKKDLQENNKYNTYVNYGLPVGPIANPGRTSFLAVLNPTKFNALYFVARGDGTHVFSNTYSEHRKNVRKYINFLRKNRKHG